MRAGMHQAMPRPHGAVKITTPEDARIVIRRAKQSDVPEMCGLLEELFSIESDFEPEAARQQKGLMALLGSRNSALLLVAEKDGEVVGMCSVHILVSTAEGGNGAA